MWAIRMNEESWQRIESMEVERWRRFYLRAIWKTTGKHNLDIAYAAMDVRGCRFCQMEEANNRGWLKLNPPDYKCHKPHCEDGHLRWLAETSIFRIRVIRSDHDLPIDEDDCEVSRIMGDVKRALEF
jgi:hypothetical protein